MATLDENSTDAPDVVNDVREPDLDMEGRDVHGFNVELKRRNVELATMEREIWSCKRRLDLAAAHGAASGYNPESVRVELANAEAQFVKAGGELAKQSKQTRSRGG